jgi:DNA-binding beta-propeller fold protein YncE
LIASTNRDLQTIIANGQFREPCGLAVDADGNVYAAEGPNSIAQAGGAFTKYAVK